MIFDISEQKMKDLFERYASYPSVLEAVSNLLGPHNLKGRIVDLSSISYDQLQAVFSNANMPCLIDLRMRGQFSYRGFLLNDHYSWDIVSDGERKVLIPFRKTHDMNNGNNGPVAIQLEEPPPPPEL